MMRWSGIAALTGGELRGPDGEFQRLSIDTRTLGAGDLYVGIRGARFDGNDFVAAAQAAGASAAVVERWIDCDLPQIKVPDGRVALGLIGQAWRRRWTGKMVGITGSNGKTTIKEMTAAVLGIAGSVLKTRGNLNNDFGVPLTLMELRPEHDFAVIEMGANHLGEIAYCAGLAEAEVAILGNAGAAHLEGFGSLEGVSRGKGEIVSALAADGIAVLNADDRFFNYWQELAGTRQVLSFGFSPEARVRADEASIGTRFGEDGFRTTFDVIYEGARYPMALALAGRHNVVNSLAAAAAGLAFGLSMDQVREGLGRVAPVPGRLEPIPARCGAWIINDAYNANPTSFGAALEAMRGLAPEIWVALGALGELGPESPELHASIGRQAKDLGVARLFGVGPNAERAVDAFGVGATLFATQEELITTIDAELSDRVALLVKGSRSQRMERVVDALRLGGT